MAWTSVGSLGATNVKGPQSYIDFNPSRAVPAGSVVVVWSAWDSLYSVFSNAGAAPYPQVIGCSDSAGNLWGELGGDNDRRCFFLCGAGIYLFICQLRAPLSTSDFIRLEIGDWTASTTLEAKAMSAWEFTLPEGYGWCATGEDPATRITFEPDDPHAMTYTTPLNMEHLWLHGLSNEWEPTDTFTWDADYTQIDSDGTTGGPGDTNITILGGWRIYTGNTDTVDVTNTTTPRDSAQILTAIMPVPKLVTFPRTPLIDDFDRADENPLDQCTVAGVPTIYNWDDTTATGPSSPGFRILQLIGNEAAAGDTGAGGQQVDPVIDCDDQEVYATYSVVSPVGGIDIQMALAGDSSEANLTGSSLIARSYPFHTGPLNWWKIEGGNTGNQGFVGHTSIFIWVPLYGIPTDGWRFGLQRWRKFMNVWIDMGGGWEWWGAWYQGQDLSGKKLGIAIWNPDDRVDDFGGGPTCFIVGTNYRTAERHANVQRIHTHVGEPPNV